MPSLEQSRQHVQQELSSRDVHDDILASLQDEIDKHNKAKDELRDVLHKHRAESSSRRLRFKRHSNGRTHRVKKPREQHHSHHSISPLSDHEAEEDPAHPFPRKSAPLDDPNPINSDAAFHDALFDALADDEGAQYWESVYNQPIHIYPRPSKSTPAGKLEAMTDEEYTAYVKTKMWEKKNPEVVIERERRERKRKEVEEERTREREEYVRRKQQKAWRSEQNSFHGRQKKSADDVDGGDDQSYGFTGHGNLARDKAGTESVVAVYTAAWEKYFKAWEKLVHDLAQEREMSNADAVPPAAKVTRTSSKRIPWPVLATKTTTKSNIEAFFEHAPADTSEKRLQLLKAERVRWHPDKVQQRFAGRVDEGTMKTVTAVFQTIDELFEKERKSNGAIP